MWRAVGFKLPETILTDKNVAILDFTSVTRSGDLLDFGQLFKAFGNS